MIPALITFGIILAILVVPYWLLVVRSEDAEKRTLHKRMKPQKLKRLERPDLLRTEQPLSSLGPVQRLLQRLAVLQGSDSSPGGAVRPGRDGRCRVPRVDLLRRSSPWRFSTGCRVRSGSLCRRLAPV